MFLGAYITVSYAVRRISRQCVAEKRFAQLAADKPARAFPYRHTAEIDRLSAATASRPVAGVTG
jgi:hypothetical protein